MNTHFRIPFLATALALAATALPVSSAEPVEPIPPEPPEPIAQSVGDARKDVDRAMAEVRQQLADQKTQMVLARARAAELAQATRARGFAGAPEPPRSGGWSTSGGRARGAGDTAIIQFSQPDPKAQADLEEDLAVMARVLEKAAADQLGEDRRSHAMGIGLDMFIGSAAHSPRALYLEDYGAVFLVDVPMALLPPPEKAESPKEKSETDAAWDEARRELYGTGAFVEDVLGKALRFEVHTGTPIAYDAKKVDGLKEGLLGALKHARNIRGLKPQDAITVCVFGTPAADGQQKHLVRLEKGDNRAEAGIVTQTEDVLIAKGGDRTSARGSVLTLRVTKADADAFAAGELDLTGLQNKAKIALYAGGTGAGKGAWSALNLGE